MYCFGVRCKYFEKKKPPAVLEIVCAKYKKKKKNKKLSEKNEINTDIFRITGGPPVYR